MGSLLCYSVPETKFRQHDGQHGNRNLRAGVRPDSQPGVLSVLLSILASKRVVLDRQYGRNRLAGGLGSPMDSAK
jgi:hypothetical protein